MKVGVRSRPAPVSQAKLMGGFTIVETMIVLAVTGALFVVIAASLTGRQNAAEFTHAIQSVQSQLQQVVDQVPDGNFPDQSVACSKGGGAPVFAGGGSQGTNNECIFLGKAIQFHVQNAGGISTEQYQVYTIAGLNTQGTTAAPFAAAVPRVVQVGGQYSTYSTAVDLEYGLQTVWMRAPDIKPLCITKACSIGAVAFLMEPGQAGNTGTGYSSGAQQVDLVPIESTLLDENLNTAVGQIESSSGVGGLGDVNLLTEAPINPAQGVQICFASGTTNQSGLITIGSTGRQLAVKLDVKSGNTLCQ